MLIKGPSTNIMTRDTRNTKTWLESWDIIPSCNLLEGLRAEGWLMICTKLRELLDWKVPEEYLEGLPLLSLHLDLCISAPWPLIWIPCNVLYNKPELFPWVRRDGLAIHQNREKLEKPWLTAIWSGARARPVVFSLQLHPYLWELTLSQGRVRRVPGDIFWRLSRCWWYPLICARNRMSRQTFTSLMSGPRQHTHLSQILRPRVDSILSEKNYL